MEEVSWQTTFEGKLNVAFNGNRKIEVFLRGKAQLCIFAMQAIRALKNEFLTGSQVMKTWRIKRFSPEEKILQIEKIEA